MPTPHDIWEKIAAFADGELDGQQCCELLREAMADPDRAKCIEHQQQLRQLLAGCMDCHETMRCPDDIKGCVEALANEHCCDPTPAPGSSTHADAKSAAPEAPRTPTVLARLGVWLPAAVAAVLLIAAIGVFSANPNNASTLAAGNSPFSTQLVRNLEARHVRCASGISNPYDAEKFPTQIEQLDDALAERLGPSLTGRPLDLSAIGYDYRVAGLCSVPGQNAIHIVYAGPAQNATGRQPMMSLWIKPFDPATDPDIAPDQSYTAANRHAPHPVLIWRDDAMIYFLVGDALPEVQKAQPLLALAS